MKRLFFTINFYAAVAYIMCINENGLTLQMDKSIILPNYNCTMNVSNENLINMTSSGGQLKIIGTQLLLNQSITISGFILVEFENITINTQTSYLDIQSPVKLTNVSLLKNCNILATNISIKDCTLSNMTLQNEQAFYSDLNVDGLTVLQSTFYKSALSLKNCSLQNIVFNEVSLINSTIAAVTSLHNFTIKNSFIVQSILIDVDISSGITIENTHFTLSTAIVGSGALYITLRNVTLSQSILIDFRNPNQIQIIGIHLNTVTSDFSIIQAQSAYVKIYNSTITNVNCSVLISLESNAALLQQLSVFSFNGKLLVAQQQLQLAVNQFKITGSISDNLFQMNGTLSLTKGLFDSNSAQYFSSRGIDRLTLEQVAFNNLSESVIFSVSDASLVDMSNINITNCSSIIFGNLSTVVRVRLLNVSMSICNECNFLLLNSTTADLSAIKLSGINNFLGSLIYIEQSTVNIQGLSIITASTKSKALIIFNQNQNLQLDDLLFSNIECAYCLGIVLIQSCQKVMLQQSIFQNSDSQEGYFKVEDSNNFTAHNNIFTNISSILGSAFLVINSDIQISHNQFMNLTSLNGGVVYLNQTTGLSHYMDDNLYDSCITKTGRYIYLISNRITEPDNLTFVAGPVYLSIDNQTISFDDLLKKRSLVKFDKIKSGQQINFNISILQTDLQQLCDYDGDIQINKTVFPFDQIRCQYSIAYSHYQSYPTAETISVDLEFTNLRFFNDTFKLSFQMNMVPCQIGEEWEDQSCLQCPRGSYSLNNFTVCLQCITSIEICPGGDVIEVRQGYWRPNTTTDLIESCKSSASNCKGGKGNVTCSEGYTGALCSDCDYYAEHWGNSYTRGWDGNCQVCSNDTFNIIKIFSSFLWILVALFISVRGSLRLVRAQLTAHYLRMIGLYFATRSTMVIDQTEILIKLVSSYFQLVSIVLIIDFDFPTPITFFAQVIGNPLSTLGFSIECFLLNSNLNVEIVYLRQFWNIFFSLSIVLVFVLIYSLAGLCRKQLNSTRTLFITCVIQVNFYFQGDILEGLLQLMFCIKASGAYYIQAATSYFCYTDEYYLYLKVFVIPTLILLGVISPLFYILKLYRNKMKLWTCQLRIPYGYLYVEYKDNYYYWEFVCFLVKSIFYLLETLLIQDVKLMFLFAILTLLIYLELLNRHQPYIEKQYTFIDKISTQLAMITLILSFSQDGIAYTSFAYILSIMCSILNLVYCTYIASKIVREYLSTLQQEHIEKIVNLIIRYPCIKYCVKIPKNYQTKRKAGLLWKKARAYVIEFIEKLKLQKSSNNMLQESQTNTLRPNTSSTNTTVSLINSMAPQLLKYIKHNRYKSKVAPDNEFLPSKKSLDQNDFTTVVSAYIDPNNSFDGATPRMITKNTVTTIYQQYVNSIDPQQ